MSLVRLTLRNARRSPIRGVFTLLAMAVTMVAFVLLRTLDATWNQRVEQTPNDRVVTRHKIGWAGTLPAHYTDVVRGLPNVTTATGMRWAGLALPSEDGVFFRSLAVSATEFLNMHVELSGPADGKAAFAEDRRGALVSTDLAQERGWKEGDVLHFRSREYPGEWELRVAALVKSTRVGVFQRTVWMHWEYLNELLPLNARDRISMIVARIDDPTRGARIAKAIDIYFDTQAEPTFSQEDKALNASIVGRFGAILGALKVLSFLVLGIVVLILGNTVAMSTRERTREYGTLRAIGFMPLHVAAFVLAEAAAIGLAGGVLGLALSYPLVQGPLSHYLEEEMRVAPLRVASGDALLALLLGALLGLLSAGIPALRAARIHVTQSLSHVA